MDLRGVQVKWLKRAWLRWQLNVADEELTEYQSRFDIGEAYLCNLMQHRTDLEWKLAALS